MTKRCPNCNSKSGVDTKGRDFCHACGKNFKDSPYEWFTLTKAQWDKVRFYPQKAITLEDCKDVGDPWPKEMVEYIKKYNIPVGDNIYWLEKYKRICFLGKDSYNNVAACWLRSLDKEPKWLVIGDVKNLVWGSTIYNGILCLSCQFDIDRRRVTKEESRICITEDIVSSIRCGKFIRTLFLSGTTLNYIYKNYLLQFEKIILFLDGDKAGQEGAKKIRNILKLDVPEIKIIRCKNDPKELDDDQLEKLLT